MHFSNLKLVSNTKLNHYIQMVKDYKTRLEEAQSLADIFEVAKSLVQKETGNAGED